jgi:hypothetical protein
MLTSAYFKGINVIVVEGRKPDYIKFFQGGVYNEQIRVS